MIQRSPSQLEWFHETIPFRYHGQKRYCRGFTIIELLTAVAILVTLAGIAIPMYLEALNKAKVTKAIADVRTMSNEISTYWLFNGRFPLSLADVGRGNFKDPYGNLYQYLEISCDETKGKCKVPQGARKDQFLKPLNSDFDLYSKGLDGLTVKNLNGQESWDDIIRAADGGFVGLASEF